MQLKIDHITLAGRRLADLVDSFTAIGLAPDYGGPHSNGISHMSLLCFDDGSYIELISTLREGEKSPSWGTYIDANGGPCAWAIRSDDINSDVEYFLSKQLPATKPKYISRKRPDGTLVEWYLAFVGENDPGTFHPFLIEDQTPRSYRATPSVSVSGSEITGVAVAVIAVKNLDFAVSAFTSTYNLAAPREVVSEKLQSPLLMFPDAPLALITPTKKGDWLDKRLDEFGVCPCAFILATNNMSKSTKRFELSHDTYWQQQDLAWFDNPGLRELRLGILSRKGSEHS